MSERFRVFEALVNTVHRLRAPDGCPWDREQTHQSIRQYLIEEAFEVLDCLDRTSDSQALLKDPELKAALVEELGDLWLQILLHSEMASEVGAFSIEDVAQALNDKLIRRHPHVFGDAAQAKSSDEAFKNWEAQKAQEKAKKKADASILDGMPKGLPALQKSARMIEKVSKVGFQWPRAQDALKKVHEELGELETEINRSTRNAERIADELGDTLFSLCNVAYLSGLGPEDALRQTLAKFERRFRHVERRLREQGQAPGSATLQEMDALWNEAKRAEGKPS